MSEMQIFLFAGCIRVVLMFCFIDFKNGFKAPELIKSMAINIFQTSIVSILMLFMFMPILFFLMALIGENSFMISIISILYVVGCLVLIYRIDMMNNLKYLKDVYSDALIAKSTLNASIVTIFVIILSLFILPVN